MSYDINANNVDCEDPAFDIGSHPVPMDASCRSAILYKQYSNTGTIGNAAGQPVSYNRQEVVFQVDPDAISRVVLNKSYLRVGFRFAKTGTATAIAAGDMTSIPWCPAAAAIDTAEFSISNFGSPCEQYNADFGHSVMARTLLKYSRDDLDNRDDLFFTPTIESGYDYSAACAAVRTTALTEESLDRKTNWMMGGIDDEIFKQIPLGDIFSSCDTPIPIPSQNLRLKLRFKDRTNISYASLTSPSVASDVLITTCELYLYTMSLSGSQLAVEANKINEPEPLMRMSYTLFEPSSKVFAAHASLQDSAVTNLQAALVMFPVLGQTYTNGVSVNYINPYQYALAPNAAMTTSLTSVFATYNGITTPNSPMNLSLNSSQNIEMYQAYLLLCKRSNDRNNAPALRYRDMISRPRSVAGTGAAITKYNQGPYPIIPFTFYSQTAYPKPVYSGSSLTVKFDGGATGWTAIVVKLRTAFIEVRPDQKTYVMK